MSDRVDFNTELELTIRDAINIIEDMSIDNKLIEASEHLQIAFNLIVDYTENKENV